MNNELTYHEVKPQFRVRRTEVQWNGGFFFIRLVWTFIPIEAKWWQNSLLYTFQFFSTFIAIAIDLIILFIVEVIIKGLLKGFVDMIFKLFGKVIGWLVLIGLAFSIFTIIYSGQWRTIYDILSKLFSQYL